MVYVCIRYLPLNNTQRVYIKIALRGATLVSHRSMKYIKHPALSTVTSTVIFIIYALKLIYRAQKSFSKAKEKRRPTENVL